MCGDEGEVDLDFKWTYTPVLFVALRLSAFDSRADFEWPLVGSALLPSPSQFSAKRINVSGSMQEAVL